MSATARLLFLLLLLCNALVLGLSFSHLAQARPKASLSFEELRVVQVDLDGGGATGAFPFEIAACALAIALALISRDQPRTAGLISLAAASLLVMIVVWVVTVLPIDRAFQAMASGAPPADWQALRDRWHGQQALRFVLALIAFLAVAWALLPQPAMLGRIVAAGEARQQSRREQRTARKERTARNRGR